MVASRNDTLAFLTPGLVHQFGNLLFTIQGNAQVMSGAAGTREQTAILGATQRGGDCLRLLRYLLGETAPAPGPIGPLLDQLTEVLRVPVREAGLGIAVRATPAGRAALVEAGPVVRVVLAAVQQLVAMVPSGSRGGVLVELVDPGNRRIGVRMRFQPVAGELPFPVAFPELAASLRALPDQGAVECSGTAVQLDLLFPLGGLTQGAQA